jgi:Ricin-type beta-trefoil lectin domain-like
MRRFGLRAAIAAASVAVGISLGIAFVPGASATSRIPAGTISFVNFNVTRCIGIVGGNAGIYTCSYVNDQAWNVIRTRNASGVSWAQLQNTRGKCLGVAGGSMSAGARVVAQDCRPHSSSQYWNNTLLNQICGSGFTPIENLKSRKVVGVSGNATGNGTPVVQWTYQKTCNNQFWVAKVDLTSPK